MADQLIATATSAGSLFSSSRFAIPPFQRLYSWTSDELEDFWDDIVGGWDRAEYFLGLIILADGAERRLVVDGQQRLITLTLLANRIYRLALDLDRRAVADSVRSRFLFALDFESNTESRRVVFEDIVDDRTLEALLADDLDEFTDESSEAREGLADRVVAADAFLASRLASHVGRDTRRLGRWVQFLESSLRFAVFEHPDVESAYLVFEAVNTRGKQLAPADLLKSYAINHAPNQDRESAYERWKAIESTIGRDHQASLVQFIRHVVEVEAGHVLARDLYGFLSGRTKIGPTVDRREPPSVGALLELLERHLPLYVQLIDPDLDGPAEPEWREVFEALSLLDVIAVRPLLLAIAAHAPRHAAEGMREVLRLVVRRTVVGNFGTGNVERRLAEAARRTRQEGAWEVALTDLSNLNPDVEEFVQKAARRSLGKSTLEFLRRSELQQSMTPSATGYLHLVRPRQAMSWSDFDLDDFSFWGSTLGNTWISTTERRPRGSSTWASFCASLLPQAAPGESVLIGGEDVPASWTPVEVESRGEEIAKSLGAVWYADGLK